MFLFNTKVTRFMENESNQSKVCEHCRTCPNLQAGYDRVIKDLKEKGITKEQYLDWWTKSYPLMEQEITDKLIARLFSDST